MTTTENTPQVSLQIRMRVHHAGVGLGWYVIGNVPEHGTTWQALRGPYTSKDQAVKWMQDARQVQAARVKAFTDATADGSPWYGEAS